VIGNRLVKPRQNSTIIRALQRLMLLVALCLPACSVLQPTDDDPRLQGSSPTAAATRTPTAMPTPTPVVVSGTVIIWHSWEEAQMPALLRRIDDFQQRYPDVQFDVLYVPALDLKAAFENASIEGRAPTLLIAPADWGGTFFEAGWVTDLSALAAPELLNRLNAAAVNQGRYKGALFGIPVRIDGVVLYRNSRLVPVSAATFDELVELSRRVEGGEEVGAYLDRSNYFSAGHLYGLGGALMDDLGQPVFDDERGRAWIELLRSFELAGPVDFFSDTDVQLFKEGRVGVIVEHTRRRAELVEAIGDFNLAIDPWPVHANGTLAGFVQSEMLYLTPRALSEEHAISWMFLQEMLSPLAQSDLAASGSIPAISGAPAVGAAGAMQIDDDLIEEAMLALVDGVPYPVAPEFQYYPAALDAALRSVFEHGALPEQALNEAADSIRAALANAVGEGVGTATPQP
jgi:ABC-type glycerol-3-phosphate transport system substrate-binding protein